MSQTPAQIAASIIATANQTIPELSFATGTPERVIVDAVAQQISAAMISQYTTGGMLDINTKSGLELDQFVGIFGFGRLQGAASQGVITITMTNASSTPTIIPINSQYYTTAGLAGATQTLYFQSNQAVTIPAGQFTSSIPATCTQTGTAGNVPPDSVTSQSAALGASTVTNLAPFSGGVNVETDAALRQRFMDTLLRNISGTSDWYINLALQNNAVSRVVVYGPTSLYKMQIAVPESTYTLPVTGPAPTTPNNVKYAWPGMTSCFQDLGTSSEVFFSPTDDYSVSSGGGPVFTTNPSGALAAMVGDVVDLEFQYTTTASRNDPANGITNKVDVFVDGSAPFTVTETCVTSTQVFSASSASMFYTGNFARTGTGTGPPNVSSHFLRLGSVPIINFPDSITVGSNTYVVGTHYWVLEGTTALKGSQLEVAGLELLTGGIPTSTQLVLNYTYNQVPQLLDAVTSTSKQICTDVLNHVADYQYITTCLTVEYSRNYAISTVNTAIVSRLQIFYQGLGFGTPVILSQLIAAVQQVLGVNEVHITTEAENSSNYGIQIVDASTDTFSGTPITTDFVLNDNQVAVYQNTIPLQAPNIGGGGS